MQPGADGFVPGFITGEGFLAEPQSTDSIHDGPSKDLDNSQINF